MFKLGSRRQFRGIIGDNIKAMAQSRPISLEGGPRGVKKFESCKICHFKEIDYFSDGIYSHLAAKYHKEARCFL